jgi:hypothetical protein
LQVPSFSPPEAALSPNSPQPLGTRRPWLNRARPTYLSLSTKWISQFSILQCDTLCQSTKYSTSSLNKRSRSAITNQSHASPSPLRPFLDCCRLSVGVLVRITFILTFRVRHAKYPLHPAWTLRLSSCLHTVLLVSVLAVIIAQPANSLKPLFIILSFLR